MKHKRMVMVYVAGPYRSKSEYELKQNVEAAWRTGAAVVALGFDLYPVVPHKNTEFMGGLRDGQYFIDGTFEQMRACHCVLIVQNDTLETTVPYKNSSGTMGEIEGAEELGIPVFYSLYQLKEWYLKGGYKKVEKKQRKKFIDTIAPRVTDFLNERFKITK